MQHNVTYKKCNVYYHVQTNNNLFHCVSGIQWRMQPWSLRGQSLLVSREQRVTTRRTWLRINQTGNPISVSPHTVIVILLDASYNIYDESNPVCQNLRCLPRDWNHLWSLHGCYFIPRQKVALSPSEYFSEWGTYRTEICWQCWRISVFMARTRNICASHLSSPKTPDLFTQMQ